MEKLYFVYILASRSRTLYVGVTSRLWARVAEHRDGRGSGFVRRYRVERLVLVESFETARAAIAREKQIKSWRREKKERLIVEANPEWSDLMPSTADRTPSDS